MTPYSVPFAQCLHDSAYKRIVFVTGAQSGKTDSFLDAIGCRLDQRPAPILYVGPTRDFVSDQFEPRLMALFDEAATLKDKVSRGKRNKKTQKWVSGVKVRLAWGGSSAALKSDPFALGIVDEYDELLSDVKGQGDPLALIEARGTTYSDFRCGIASTPSRGLATVRFDEKSGMEFWDNADPEGFDSAIWKLWQEGTRHHWAWPCPQCGDYFIPRFKQLRWPKDCTPYEARKSAFLECPRCGGVIEESHKREMNARGLYVAPGQFVADGAVVGEPPERSTASFWCSGLASPFRTFGERAEAYLLALQTGEQPKIQTALNAQFGEIYAPIGGDVPEWTEVSALRMPYKYREIPEGVRFLTAGVDVQADRLIYTVRGWGFRQESWQIESGILWGDTKLDDVWLDLSDLLEGSFGNRYIRMAFVDSGWKPNQLADAPESKVYEWARAHKRYARAIKAYNRRQTPLHVSRIDIKTDGKKQPFGLELVILDAGYGKSFVHDRIKLGSDKPGAWHLADDADEEYCRQIVAEARIKGDTGKLDWVRRTKDNHFLDCECYAYMAALFCGVNRLVDRGQTSEEPDAQDAEEPETEQPKWTAEGQPETVEPKQEIPALPPNVKGQRASLSQSMARWAEHFNKG